jgi:hypothetical protein
VRIKLIHLGAAAAKEQMQLHPHTAGDPHSGTPPAFSPATSSQITSAAQPF